MSDPRNGLSANGWAQFIANSLRPEPGVALIASPITENIEVAQGAVACRASRRGSRGRVVIMQYGPALEDHAPDGDS